MYIHTGEASTTVKRCAAYIGVVGKSVVKKEYSKKKKQKGKMCLFTSGVQLLNYLHFLRNYVMVLHLTIL